MSAAIIARDHAKIKIKDCCIGGFDRSWHQATDGIVAKGRADVRVKGGRIEMFCDGVGVAVAVHNSAQLILHQVVIHSGAIGVHMEGEARVRVTKSIFRDLQIAALCVGSASAAQQELWLGENTFYGPAPLWGGDLRPARLVGESEWHAHAPPADNRHAAAHNGTNSQKYSIS